MKKVVDIRTQLLQYCQGMRMQVRAAGDAAQDAESIRKCFCAGFFLNVAVLRADNKYRTLSSDAKVSSTCT